MESDSDCDIQRTGGLGVLVGLTAVAKMKTRYLVLMRIHMGSSRIFFTIFIVILIVIHVRRRNPSQRKNKIQHQTP